MADAAAAMDADSSYGHQGPSDMDPSFSRWGDKIHMDRPCAWDGAAAFDVAAAAVAVVDHADHY